MDTGELHKNLLTIVGSLGAIQAEVKATACKVDDLSCKVDDLSKQTFGGAGAGGKDLDARVVVLEDHVATQATVAQARHGRWTRYEGYMAGGFVASAIELGKAAYAFLNRPMPPIPPLPPHGHG